jgi:ketosteroid isomerase-like protein
MRRLFEEFAARGWEAMLPMVADDFELITPPGLAAEPDTYRGKEGIRRYWESFYEAMEEIHLEALEFRDVGEWVVVPFVLTARGRATGLEAAQEAVTAWKLRDGLVVRCLAFAELEEALAEIEKLSD